MTTLQAIILGIIQGITEFLPISSSAHLVLAPYLLGWKIPAHEAFIFNVLVQVASLVGVFAVFRKELISIIIAVIRGLVRRRPFEEVEARLGWLIVLATIPAGIAGLTFKETVEASFNSPALVGLFLFVTAGMLILAERLGHMDHDLADLSWKSALLIGVAQATALFPGISRSGATIAGGISQGLRRPAAARFAFMMSIPVMFAAGVLTGKDLLAFENIGKALPYMVPGLITSAVVSFISIRWLIGYLVSRRLYPFAVYCTLLGLLILGLNYYHSY